MQSVLLVVQIIIAVSLIGVVIFLQRTAQDGGGLMGGGNTMGGLFTPRGTANIFTTVTKFLATIFILNSLALGYIASSQHQSKSLLDQIPSNAPATSTVPAAPSNSSHDVPSSPSIPEVPLAK